MVIRKIRKKEKMKKYYRITKDITLIDGENLSDLKRGDIAFGLYTPSPENEEEKKFAILNKNIILPFNIVNKHKEIFEEITREEFDFQLNLATIRNLLNETEIEERKRIIQELFEEFCMVEFEIPINRPHEYSPGQLPPLTERVNYCHVCGHTGNNPCGSIHCPNRLTFWCSTNTNDIK